MLLDDDDRVKSKTTSKYIWLIFHVVINNKIVNNVRNKPNIIRSWFTSYSNRDSTELSKWLLKYTLKWFGIIFITY
jgi:hypothetical protein